MEEGKLQDAASKPRWPHGGKRGCRQASRYQMARGSRRFGERGSERHPIWRRASREMKGAIIYSLRSIMQGLFQNLKNPFMQGLFVFLH
jgi:hypothetical protein